MDGREFLVEKLEGPGSTKRTEEKAHLCEDEESFYCHAGGLP